MHITSETDYAVRIVHCLAQSASRMDAKAISDKTGVTLRFSLKILRKLVGGEIVRSYKGTKGGYELNKAPTDISIADVIETVEGKYALARCVGADEYECSRNKDTCVVCKFREIYADITDTVQEKLESVKFSDLLD